MEISRYASRLARSSSVLPSGRPAQLVGKETTDKETNERRKIAPTLSPRSSSSLRQEPDDASLTGGTRSLARRLLALNIPGLSVLQPGKAEGFQKPSAKLRKSREKNSKRPGFVLLDA